jgi:ABC-2 type transport system ATP-binding protein
MLKFEDFRKSYGSHLVLDISDFQLLPGTYWLRGGNGTGKSSLLRCLSGMDSFEGKLRVEGLSAKRDGVGYRRLVNFAEAEPQFPGFLRGSELIAMFEQAKGDGTRTATALLTEMGMDGYIESPIGSYSSGMLKKLSLVLSFLGTPKWIMLDEPLNTLDVDAVRILYGWIQRGHETDGISFILSSHQMLDLAILPFANVVEIVSKQLVSK